MENELKELKSVLRSIVVSSSVQVDVRSLLRDYRNMMGAPLPLTKYGYRDPVTFLKERFADCFLFSGFPSNPTLTLIVPDTLKHIDVFVQKQKISSAVKSVGKRRSVPGHFQAKSSEHHTKQKPQDLIYKTFDKHSATKQTSLDNNINNNEVCTQNRTQTKPEGKAPETSSKVNTITNRLAQLTSNSTTSAKSSDNTTSVQNDIKDTNSESSDRSTSSAHQVLRKKLIMYNSSQYLNRDTCDASDVDQNQEHTSSGVSCHQYDEEDDSGRQTSSSQLSSKRAELEELQNEIYELVKEHEDGIWCTDLLRLYRSRFGRALEPARGGQGSLSGVLHGMRARVLATPLAGGVRLHVASRAPRPAPPARTAPPARPAHPPRAPLHLAADDALPGILYDPAVFPDDCMHYNDSIPPLGLGDVRVGAMLDVKVGEVYSPSHFWLLRLGERHDIAMEEMMDDMTEFYERGGGRALVLPCAALAVGHYCSSLFERDWHRSVIVALVDADTVKVRHVDYGTVDTVRRGALKPLPRRWAALPAQGVRARLAGVRPARGSLGWPHAAAAHFLHLVRDTPLVANVVALDAEEETLEVFLVDTRGAEDECVSRALIRGGHAERRADSSLRTGELHLYPTFAALENGDTPNYAEIVRYIADGISPDYVEAYRRHVPAARLAAVPAGLAALPGSPPPPPSPPPVELVNRVPLLRRSASPLPAPAPRDPAEPEARAPLVSPSRPSAPPHVPFRSSHEPFQTSQGPFSPSYRPFSPYGPVAPFHGPVPPLQGSVPPPPGPVLQLRGPAPPQCAPEPRLSAAEWEVYCKLSALDAAAAHYFLLCRTQPAPPCCAPPPPCCGPAPLYCAPALPYFGPSPPFCGPAPPYCGPTPPGFVPAPPPH